MPSLPVRMDDRGDGIPIGQFGTFPSDAGGIGTPVERPGGIHKSHQLIA